MTKQKADSEFPAVDEWRSINRIVTFRNRLLTWFDKSKRDLPWRKNRDPYRIWVSEIMLQQTQVTTVIDYFHEFMQRFPNIKALAKANEREVLRAWEGLGYYRRARQLHSSARIIAERNRGGFPSDFAEILKLPGVGRYTAGAIASIAFDDPQPILEGNTVRLFARLLGLNSDVGHRHSQRQLWEFSRQLVAGRRPGDFNQALMELGSQVCRIKQPQCINCPVKSFCNAFQMGQQNLIPYSAQKMEYESVAEAVVIARRKKDVLMRQCQSSERWAGLWDFPRFVLPATDRQRFLEGQMIERFGLQVKLTVAPFRARHSVTRYKIDLSCYLAEIESGRIRRNQSAKWISLKELVELPLSVTGRRIARKLGEISS